MTALRDRLQSELASKVERHGVVIWDDPEGAYASVAAEVVPDQAILLDYSGSWFELRHQLEKSLAGQSPPPLVAYVPTKPEDPDPLEELRAVGARFRITLPTLLKSALGGQLTEQRLVQIGRQCSTIIEAEAALEGGESAIDARLISVTGDSSTAVIAASLIAGTHSQALADRGLSDVERATLTEAIGGNYGDLAGDDLRASAFRHVVLVLLAAAIGELPEQLRSSLMSVTAAQRKTCSAVLVRLQSDAAFVEQYCELAASADLELHLGVLLDWHDRLAACDETPTIEVIALTEAFRRLGAGEDQAAVDLAQERLVTSWWTRPTAPNGTAAATRWRAVRALGRLGVALAAPIPALPSLAATKKWYASTGWRVDSAYRHSELIRVTSGDAIDELDELYQTARQRYEDWLDRVLRAASDAVAQPDVPTGELQRSIHTQRVRKAGDRTAYLLVDALRYELGVDLVDRLASVNADVQIEAVVGTPPTITPVGMASVLPGADTAFQIGLGENDRLNVAVGGSRVSVVKDRVQRLELAHGKVADLLLDDVAQSSNKELKKKIGDAALVLVRSTEIDADGESDQLAASWGSFDTILNVLHTAVARLLHAGIERIVITADHGFLAVRQLGEDRRIDKPATGTGEQHRRAWIGRGGTASASTIKVPLAAFGISGGLDIITPRGLGVFTSGGGLQFFHGGLSPQELIVPVITAVAKDGSPEPQYRIDLAVAGERITTGIVAATVTMTGDLFTRESRVRLQLMQDGQRVGIVVGGDGFDQSTETIDASVDTPRVITMQITGNLAAGSTATLEVIDAATGVQLAKRDVDVTTNIMVDDLD